MHSQINSHTEFANIRPNNVIHLKNKTLNFHEENSSVKPSEKTVVLIILVYIEQNVL